MNRHDLYLLGQALLPPFLLIVGAFFAVRGASQLRQFWRKREDHDAPFLLVRGGRGVIVAIACACLCAALTFEARGLLYFGLGFLGEELYETGVVLLILRGRQRREARAALAA